LRFGATALAESQSAKVWFPGAAMKSDTRRAEPTDVDDRDAAETIRSNRPPEAARKPPLRLDRRFRKGHLRCVVSEPGCRDPSRPF
jgi:hypothetical protein